MKKFLVGLIIYIIAMTVFFTLTASDGKSNSANNHAHNGMDLKELNIQFVPSIQSETLLAKAKPLEQLLSQQLGIPVHVSLSTDTNSVIEAMGSKKVDMGFLSPDAYVTAHREYGANVILQSTRFGIKDDNTGDSTGKLTDRYHAIVIVGKDSNIKTAKDLKGKKIAVQGPTSTAGYVFPAVELNQKGINITKESTLVQVKGHDQGVLAVLKGDTDATFIFGDARNVLKKDRPDVFDKTRILYTTSAIPNDTVTLRKDITASDSHKIKQAMKEIATTPDGKKVLHDVYAWQGVADSNDSNFDTVRSHNKLMERIR
ncbi:phosphate/phosphite/phosphonate ABC transporter substrate-binding protein [Convivina intestini]|uniref:Phosphonate transport system substrate-binding protein n=1 Tax=Convivina intestini TaxID=1505726 RepID=A0A2U1DF31_9LACO|nr:phosphate/phosphite/phosphonate ABC transporter substrate-binding protein [Convivina intestini]PVY86278.1 phosphonate transport system substrate-binding protein [Convivina intestini]CAH1851078.1 Phosphate-import protein PhnD [Convivina intestini]SDB82112.1 phosphonate transport system substrate-binding protein [Leuconostocaceae bacterium R-53105]